MVTWQRNGEMLLEASPGLEMTQWMRDPLTSTYDNLLCVTGDREGGDFSCTVVNDQGKATARVSVKGIYCGIFCNAITIEGLRARVV